MLSNLTFLNEPYIIGFLIALIFTGIYYLIQRMSKKTEEEDKKSNKKQSKSTPMSNEMKSILIFISSFCFFTGGMYFYNNMKNPIENITENISTISDITSQLKDQVGGLISNRENEEKIIEEVLANENVDEIFSSSPVEKKKKIYVDQEFIAGKKRSSSSKNKEYRHMMSREAKYVDNDIDLGVSPF